MKHRLDVVRGFSSLCLYCVVVVIHFFWLVNACFCCIRFHFFPYQAKSQEIGLGERLQNDLFLCWVGHKTLLTHSETLAFSCILIRILLHICQVNLASRMLISNCCKIFVYPMPFTDEMSSFIYWFTRERHHVTSLMPVPRRIGNEK